MIDLESMSTRIGIPIDFIKNFDNGKMTEEELKRRVISLYKFEKKHFVNDKIEDWDHYTVPTNYEINNGGVFTYKDRELKCVCSTPFILSGISQPLNNEMVHYKVRFANYKGEVKEFWASQYDLLSKRELKKLFNSKGINCPENTLLNLIVGYISSCIADYGSKLKNEISVTQNGWNENTFIWGKSAIKRDSVEPVLPLKEFPGLEKKGSLEAWVNAVTEILKYDVARFRLYDAMTATINQNLGIESHCTDHYGNTSSGKTLMSTLAISMIGNPSELIIGAKGTVKGILVRVRDYSDLPVLIDETSDAGDNLTELVYTLASGKGRVKSTKEGDSDGGELYRTTAMLTGEKPIRDCLNNSGQQFRVIELDDSLPELKNIEKIKREFNNNYGHVIIPFIQEVMKNDIQAIYDNCFNALPGTKNNIEARSKSIFACIMTSGFILEKVFKKVGIPEKDPVTIVNKYFKECIQDKPIELEYIRALNIVLDWVHSEYSKFALPELNFIEKIRYGYIDGEFLDIIGSEFTKKMKKENFSPSKIKSDWHKLGIIKSNDKNRVGTCRFEREGKTITGVRINLANAGDILGHKIIL